MSSEVSDGSGSQSPVYDYEFNEQEYVDHPPFVEPDINQNQEKNHTISNDPRTDTELSPSIFESPTLSTAPAFIEPDTLTLNSTLPSQSQIQSQYQFDLSGNVINEHDISNITKKRNIEQEKENEHPNINDSQHTPKRIRTEQIS